MWGTSKLRRLQSTKVRIPLHIASAFNSFSIRNNAASHRTSLPTDSQLPNPSPNSDASQHESYFLFPGHHSILSGTREIISTTMTRQSDVGCPRIRGKQRCSPPNMATPNFSCSPFHVPELRGGHGNIGFTLDWRRPATLWSYGRLPARDLRTYRSNICRPFTMINRFPWMEIAN